MKLIILMMLIHIANAETFRACVIDARGRTYCSTGFQIDVNMKDMTQNCEFFEYDAMLCTNDKSYCGCRIRSSNNCTNGTVDVFEEVQNNSSCNSEAFITALILISITLGFSIMINCMFICKCKYTSSHNDYNSVN